VNIAVAIVLVVTGSVYLWVHHELDKITRVKIPTLVPTGPGALTAFTVLVVGDDARSVVRSAADQRQFGSTSQDPESDSDAIILVRVDPATRILEVLSIPRDIAVPVEGANYERLDDVFQAGPARLVQALETDLGTPINHYVEVNFDTFRTIDTAIGGIRMYFPTPARDALSDLDIPAAGCVTLDGNQALAFVRSRHYQYFLDDRWTQENGGDLDRIQRQQIFLRQMLHQAEYKAHDPSSVIALVDAVTSNLTVDSGFSSSAMVRLAKLFDGLNVASVRTETLPTISVFETGDYVLAPQPEAARQMVAQFNSIGNLPAASDHPERGSAPIPPPAPIPASPYELPGSTSQSVQIAARCT
jgi:polyisoprenyl-teichoic acid--peptidoglycan teichoic acid transferase